MYKIIQVSLNMNQAKNVKSFKGKNSIIKMKSTKEKKNLVYNKNMNVIYDNNIAHPHYPTTQEISKNRKVVSSKLGKVYDWLISYVPKPIKWVKLTD